MAAGDAARGDWLSRFLDFWFEAVDPVRLDAFRRIFSLTFLAYTLTWFLEAHEWLTAYGFHYTADNSPAGEPLPWPLLPAGLLPVFGVVFFGSLTALIVGLWPRLFVWVVLACAVYIDRADILAAYTVNKLYVLGYVVLALAPAPRELHAPGGSGRVLRQSAWPLRVLQATVVVHYCGSGLCKVLHGDWLSSTDVVWAQVQGAYRTDIAAWMLRTLPPSAWTLLMIGGIGFELFGVWLLVFRRTRPLGLVYGILFHVGVSLLMYRLIFFSAQMVALYVVFLSAEACRRLVLKPSAPT